MLDYHEVENFVQDFFYRMGWPDVSVVIRADQETDETTDISLSVFDAKFLIGAGGKNLESIQHILGVIFNKKFGLQSRVRLDINNYRKDRINYLRELARSTAQKVGQTKKPIVFPPMSSYERRIIHTELASRPDVVTESKGEGAGRQVVVKPYE